MAPPSLARCLKLLLCGLALEALALPALAAQEAPAWAPVTVPAAQQRDLQSARTGHGYRIFMAVPALAPPPEGYPVLYVLDGNAAFPVAAFLARSAASRQEVTGHSPPLVVGIGYPGQQDFDVPARRRDYTVGPRPPAYGGGRGFVDVLAKEG